MEPDEASFEFIKIVSMSCRSHYCLAALAVGPWEGAPGVFFGREFGMDLCWFAGAGGHEQHRVERVEDARARLIDARTSGQTRTHATHTYTGAHLVQHHDDSDAQHG